MTSEIQKVFEKRRRARQSAAAVTMGHLKGDERETTAIIKIQAFLRSAMTRQKVSDMVLQLMENLKSEMEASESGGTPGLEGFEEEADLNDMVGSSQVGIEEEEADLNDLVEHNRGKADNGGSFASLSSSISFDEKGLREYMQGNFSERDDSETRGDEESVGEIDTKIQTYLDSPKKAKATWGGLTKDITAIKKGSVQERLMKIGKSPGAPLTPGRVPAVRVRDRLRKMKKTEAAKLPMALPVTDDVANSTNTEDQANQTSVKDRLKKFQKKEPARLPMAHDQDSNDGHSDQTGQTSVRDRLKRFQKTEPKALPTTLPVTDDNDKDVKDDSHNDPTETTEDDAADNSQNSLTETNEHDAADHSQNSLTETNEEYEKDEQILDNAAMEYVRHSSATTIQALARGYLYRMQEESYRDESTSRDEAGVSESTFSESNEEVFTSLEERQRAFLAKAKLETVEPVVAKASREQTLAKMTARQKRMHTAATKIQAIVRGFLERNVDYEEVMYTVKMLKEYRSLGLIEEDEEAENAVDPDADLSAVGVQAFAARHIQLYNAATKIQALGRGYLCRKFDLKGTMRAISFVMEFKQLQTELIEDDVEESEISLIPEPAAKDLEKAWTFVQNNFTNRTNTGVAGASPTNQTSSPDLPNHVQIDENTAPTDAKVDVHQLLKTWEWLKAQQIEQNAQKMKTENIQHSNQNLGDPAGTSQAKPSKFAALGSKYQAGQEKNKTTKQNERDSDNSDPAVETQPIATGKTGDVRQKETLKSFYGWLKDSGLADAVEKGVPLSKDRVIGMEDDAPSKIDIEMEEEFQEVLQLWNWLENNDFDMERFRSYTEEVSFLARFRDIQRQDQEEKTNKLQQNEDMQNLQQQGLVRKLKQPLFSDQQNRVDKDGETVPEKHRPSLEAMVNYWGVSKQHATDDEEQPTSDGGSPLEEKSQDAEDFHTWQNDPSKNTMMSTLKWLEGNGVDLDGTPEDGEDSEQKIEIQQQLSQDDIDSTLQWMLKNGYGRPAKPKTDQNAARTTAEGESKENSERMTDTMPIDAENLGKTPDSSDLATALQWLQKHSFLGRKERPREENGADVASGRTSNDERPEGAKVQDDNEPFDNKALYDSDVLHSLSWLQKNGFDLDSATRSSGSDDKKGNEEENHGETSESSETPSIDLLVETLGSFENEDTLKLGTETKSNDQRSPEEMEKALMWLKKRGISSRSSSKTQKKASEKESSKKDDKVRDPKVSSENETETESVGSSEGAEAKARKEDDMSSAMKWLQQKGLFGAKAKKNAEAAKKSAAEKNSNKKDSKRRSLSAVSTTAAESALAALKEGNDASHPSGRPSASEMEEALKFLNLRKSKSGKPPRTPSMKGMEKALGMVQKEKNDEEEAKKPSTSTGDAPRTSKKAPTKKGKKTSGEKKSKTEKRPSSDNALKHLNAASKNALRSMSTEEPQEDTKKKGKSLKAGKAKKTAGAPKTPTGKRKTVAGKKSPGKKSPGQKKKAKKKDAVLSAESTSKNEKDSLQEEPRERTQAEIDCDNAIMWLNGQGEDLDDAPYFQRLDNLLPKRSSQTVEARGKEMAKALNWVKKQGLLVGGKKEKKSAPVSQDEIDFRNALRWLKTRDEKRVEDAAYFKKLEKTLAQKPGQPLATRAREMAKALKWVKNSSSTSKKPKSKEKTSKDSTPAVAASNGGQDTSEKWKKAKKMLPTVKDMAKQAKARQQKNAAAAAAAASSGSGDAVSQKKTDAPEKSGKAAPSAPTKPPTPEEDFEHALQFILAKQDGQDTSSLPSALHFKSLDNMLPKKKNQTPEERAKEMVKMLGWLRKKGKA